MTAHTTRGRAVHDDRATTSRVSDPTGTHERAANRLLAQVPDQFRGDVDAWVAALRGVGRRPSRPVAWVTVRTYLHFALPVLQGWSHRFSSLREITRDDIEQALAYHAENSPHNVHTALRSLFRGLKREKRIFTDPARGVVGHYARRLPRLLPSDRLRGLLNQIEHPRDKLAVALVAVHALGVDELRHLLMEDLDRSAATLIIPRRRAVHRVVLDDTLMKLAHDWIAYRARRWPLTRNPNLFVSAYTVSGEAPMSQYGVCAGFRHIGITARQLRQDRILDEATHTADPVALITVFGLGVTTAIRYIHAAHPDRFPSDPITP
jgi:integrase